MQTRLKKVKEVITDWFKGHAFVKEVNFGDFIQMYMSNQLEHSSIVIDLIAVPEITRSKVGYQFLITYTDRLYPDRRNLDEIKNDTIRVFQDFIIAVNNDVNLRQYITGLTSSGVQMFTQSTKDLVAGGVMTVTLNIFSEQNVCEIPVNVMPHPVPSCPDVTLQVNSTTQGTFPSGSTIDVQLTDGVNPVIPDDVSISGSVVTVELPPVLKDASIQIVYQEGDEQAIHTLITSNTFTITAIATTLNITNVEVNGAAVNVPFQLENGDLLEIEFDAAPSVGVINLTGNYV